MPAPGRERARLVDADLSHGLAQAGLTEPLLVLLVALPCLPTYLWGHIIGRGRNGYAALLFARYHPPPCGDDLLRPFRFALPLRAVLKSNLRNVSEG
jgi:hypothetical protein